MTDEKALLQYVLANPDDDTARLVYADCLQEAGEATRVARAELIRAQVALAKLPAEAPEAEELAARQNDLLEQFGDEWRAVLGPWAVQSAFERGMIEAVAGAAATFPRHAA